MAIRAIEAKVECDGCGHLFHHDLDPAAIISQETDSVVVDSTTLRPIDTKDVRIIDLISYVEAQLDIVGEHVLCPDCLNKVCIGLPDIDEPTYDQVHRVVSR
jgi:hypothetical protein